MNCPLCLDETLVPNHRAGIEIDVCPRCRGVWLDRGELDRLTSSPEPEPTQRTSPRRHEHDDRDRNDKAPKKGKKKKSKAKKLGDLLEDILDL